MDSTDSKSKSSFEFYVGSGSVLEGATLEVTGVARVDGTVSGTIKANHLIVGESGFVTGDISADSADVEGRLEDTIKLTGKLCVRSTGRVKGKISYGTIEALEGAKIVGEMMTQYETPEPARSSSVSGLAAALSLEVGESDGGPADTEPSHPAAGNSAGSKSK